MAARFIDRVIANRRVRASARLDTEHAVGRKSLVSHEKLRVFARVDIIGHDSDESSSRSHWQSRSTSIVFPEPTGPPTPMRTSLTAQ